MCLFGYRRRFPGSRVPYAAIRAGSKKSFIDPSNFLRSFSMCGSHGWMTLKLIYSSPS
jgi:hypothetical protein